MCRPLLFSRSFPQFAPSSMTWSALPHVDNVAHVVMGCLGMVGSNAGHNSHYGPMCTTTLRWRLQPSQPRPLPISSLTLPSSPTLEPHDAMCCAHITDSLLELYHGKLALMRSLLRWTSASSASHVWRSMQ
ncbi:hypothetical protein D1007_18154 [Hordeum vulgare]|nr:hypothetical protein D1007_18154 [Hordeum vulgare]